MTKWLGASLLVLLLLAGCRKLPYGSLLLGPPAIPKTPPLQSEKGYIKAAGMMPDTVFRSHVFWMAGDRLLVVGDGGGSMGWRDFYDDLESILHPPRKSASCAEDWKLTYPLIDLKQGTAKPVQLYAGYAKFAVPDDATHLSDGRLLIWRYARDSIRPGKEPVMDNLGGCNPDFMPIHGGVTFIEELDPNHNTVRLFRINDWDRQGSLTVMPDGKVYLAGGKAAFEIMKYPGLFETMGMHSDIQVYDPEQRTLTPYMRLASARTGHVAAAMPDGEHLMLVGGLCIPVDPQGKPLQKPLKGLDPDDMARNCNSLEYVDLKNKRAQIVGHLIARPPEYQDQLPKKYNPLLPEVLTSRANGRSTPLFAVALNNHQVLIVGGFNIFSPYPILELEVFDLETRKSRIVGKMEYEGLPHIQNVLRMSDGSVVILTAKDLYLYDIQQDQFLKLDRLITDRREYGAAVSPEDKVYIAGGVTFNADPRLIEVFDYRAYRAQTTRSH